MRKELYLLISPTLPKKELEKRQELIALIEDYFGEEDAELVLEIALYFKSPGKFGYLFKEIKKKLEMEP